MADKKISELTSINGADVEDTNDTIAIVDSSAGQTKKITRGELFKTNTDADINGLTVGRGAGDVSTNSAVGSGALDSNTTGASNTASGRDALYSNTTGASNTAHGYQALQSNTTGGFNTATGFEALKNNTTGTKNTSVGQWAGFVNTTGSRNTTIGYQADAISPTADNQIAIRAGATKWYSSAGTPEGAVTAGVGSMYTDNTGGAGTTLYVKESGTGNTGWVAQPPAASVAVYVDATGGASADSTSDVTVPTTTAEIEDSTNYSNTSGVVTVTNAGTYVIKGNVNVMGTTSSYRWTGELSIVKGGSTVLGKIQGGYLRAQAGSDETYVNIDKMVVLAAGDTIELKSKRISSVSGDGTFVADMSTLQLHKL